MKKFFGLFVLALLVYGFSLLWWVPAAWVWKQVESRVPAARAGVVVEAVSGTLWDGAAAVRVQGVPLTAHWDVRWKELLSGHLGLNVILGGQGIELPAIVRAGLGNLDLIVDRGVVGLQSLNPWWQRNRTQVTGNVDVRGLQVILKDGMLQRLAGSLRWSGGPVSYPAGAEMHQRNLTPVETEIVPFQGGYLADVREPGADPLAQIILGPDGMAVAKIYKRAVDWLNEPWPRGGQPSDVVFQVKRRIMPALNSNKG